MYLKKTESLIVFGVFSGRSLIVETSMLWKNKTIFDHLAFKIDRVMNSVGILLESVEVFQHTFLEDHRNGQDCVFKRSLASEFLSITHKIITSTTKLLNQSQNHCNFCHSRASSTIASLLSRASTISIGT